MKNIHTMPSHSRVWVYQSSRLLSEDEVNLVKQKSAAFLTEWTSHNNHMDACIDVLHNCFVIVSVDEKTAPASGCGIDKSVRFIQQLEKELNISLLGRTTIAYRDKQRNISFSSINEFENASRLGLINENTIVYNNLVTNKEELSSNWEVPVSNSWCAKFLVKA